MTKKKVLDIDGLKPKILECLKEGAKHTLTIAREAGLVNNPLRITDILYELEKEDKIDHIKVIEGKSHAVMVWFLKNV